jgi:hypothetical protein
VVVSGITPPSSGRLEAALEAAAHVGRCASWENQVHRVSVALVFALSAHCALACEPITGWHPPSPREAFSFSSVVLHVRVLSQEGLDPSVVNVEVLHLLKGEFSGHVVHTASHSMCGVGELTSGVEYVFFIPNRERLFVTHLNQPQGLSAAQVLQALGSTSR